MSALIHAATLVTAGVYILVRTHALWECSDICRSVCVWVGAFTSLLAATCGLFQNDMKRVIAYSTCSQLGYQNFPAGTCIIVYLMKIMFLLVRKMCIKHYKKNTQKKRIL